MNFQSNETQTELLNILVVEKCLYTRLDYVMFTYNVAIHVGENLIPSHFKCNSKSSNEKLESNLSALKTPSFSTII